MKTTCLFLNITDPSQVPQPTLHDLGWISAALRTENESQDLGLLGVSLRIGLELWGPGQRDHGRGFV